jgi:hypothetical protein
MKNNETNADLEKVNGGIELIGKKVCIWKDSKSGRFLAKGTIIDYHKSKGKGYGKNTIMKGKYLIDFGNNKRFWHTRSEFNFS